jgi:hypothetical protein
MEKKLQDDEILFSVCNDARTLYLNTSVIDLILI